MEQFFKENYIWAVPITVAIITGLVKLISILCKKSKPSSVQKAKNINNSIVNQIGGNQTRQK